ncbi:conserved protein of unknown function (plasmid) [Rhodovastum atsumiense]|uniref:Uncharacterized protein n=1 Tax=Rhodovastum atsumiense TaxID=504468 RepID=A0A5M6IVZ3_9PROT|nr:hypothetical protein [Rhodovastum atsumiense]KAA5611658.1 hypothetical protein F1189_13945 [Rhodovastum atsumiense]CAH2606242.1 conserved protein of unknown function [Rhodovastum atsumiense]
MARYVKRRPEIEAVQWNGFCFSEPAPSWLTDAMKLPAYAFGGVERIGADLVVWTLKGPVRAHPGDWLVRWAVGELWVIPPVLFAATYEPAP